MKCVQVFIYELPELLQGSLPLAHSRLTSGCHTETKRIKIEVQTLKQQNFHFFLATTISQFPKAADSQSPQHFFYCYNIYTKAGLKSDYCSVQLKKWKV